MMMTKDDNDGITAVKMRYGNDYRDIQKVMSLIIYL